MELLNGHPASGRRSVSTQSDVWSVVVAVSGSVSGVAQEWKLNLWYWKPFLCYKCWVSICSDFSPFLHPENPETVYSFFFFYSHHQAKVMITESDAYFFANVYICVPKDIEQGGAPLELNWPSILRCPEALCRRVQNQINSLTAYLSRAVNN